jgi:hypothetical protein
MERKAVLAKTPKGQDEVRSRAHGLNRKLRSLLIMVDGSATAGDILAKCAGIPDVEAALESLVSQGFVEMKGADPGAAASAPAAAPKVPSVGATQPPPNPAPSPPPVGATQPPPNPAPQAASVGTTQPLPNPAAPSAPPLGATQPLPSPAVRSAPPLGATQPIPVPAAPAQPREAAMAELLGFLADNLGSSADVLTGALKSAATRDGFHVAAERCAHALAAAQGASTAQAFRDRARAYLDAYLAGG